MNHRSTRRALLVLTGALVALAAPLLGVRLSRSEPHTTLARASSYELPGERVLSTPEVERSAVGVLLAPQMAQLAPRVPGRVFSVRVAPGQRVRQGEVLLTFDARERRYELLMATAQLKVARAEATRAATERTAASRRAARRQLVARADDPALASSLSDEEVDQAQLAAESERSRETYATARVAEQRAHVEQLQLALEESELRAPFDGVVSAVQVDVGTTVLTGTPVVSVVGGHGLRARIAVPEPLGAWAEARHARLVLPDRSLLLQIESVSPEPEPASRTFLLEGKVVAEDGADRVDARLVGLAVRATILH